MRGGAKVYKSSLMETHVHFFICSYGSFSLTPYLRQTIFLVQKVPDQPSSSMKLRHKEEELRFLLALPRGLPGS